MQKKATITVTVLIIFSIIGVYVSSIEKVVFINVKPTIKMGDIEYIVTNNIISNNKLAKQVGKVTQIIDLVSFIDNPYKSLGRVYKIKDKNIDKEVALEMNGKLHIAKSIGFISDK